VLLLLVAAFLLPLPYDPIEPDVGPIMGAPSVSHLFGTDQLGRDVFSRTIAAGRLDIVLVLASVGLTVVVGVGLGLAVSSRTVFAERLMRVLDVFQALPLLVLAMALVSVSGNSLVLVAVSVAMIGFPTFVRLVRAESLALRESRFIEAAVSIGADRRRILVHHMLPNVGGIILVNAAVCASRAILVIAGLSFLGIGVQPPTASWGQMIEQGIEGITSGQWWVWAFPGLFVLILGACFNRVADGLDTLQAGVGRG
ncbi:ABC transporter permease, partial [Pseudonocardia pini]|uniref:ABC transporter permease n=1 Tax=Pseudonocardia pini TaxID=2758030 RepID=UPI0015F11CD9